LVKIVGGYLIKTRNNPFFVLLLALLAGLAGFYLGIHSPSSLNLIYSKETPNDQPIIIPANNSTNTTNNTTEVSGNSGNITSTNTVPERVSLEDIEASFKISIPKLGVNCGISSDTVNDYNTVYHYTESVSPGENGECGLLGHRTTYSAPFAYIRILKPGDLVIIYDEINRKRYNYLVESNGQDIRWDYKTNPLTFETDGTPRLLLVTCYPPGQTSAAWITHCTLDSSGSY